MNKLERHSEIITRLDSIEFGLNAILRALQQKPGDYTFVPYPNAQDQLAGSLAQRQLSPDEQRKLPAAE